MRDIYYITDLDQLKVISDPLRIKIIWEINETAKTGKMIADLLGVPAPKVHYHLKELEKVGLVKVERVAEKNGIMQKFYRPIARIFSLEKISLQQKEELSVLSNTLRESMLVQLDKSKSIVKRADDASFMKEKSIMNTYSLQLTERQMKLLKEQLKSIDHLLEQFAEEDADEQTDLYHFTMIGLPVIEAAYPDEE